MRPSLPAADGGDSLPVAVAGWWVYERSSEHRRRHARRGGGDSDGFEPRFKLEEMSDSITREEGDSAMRDVTPENCSKMMRRFYSFYDAVVSTVDIHLRGGARICRIVVECQDREVDSGWSTVTFEVHRPSEFRFELGRTTFEVLSSGIQIGWREGSVFLVLDAYPDDPGDLPSLRANTAYVAGDECTWQSQPLKRS